MTTEKINEIIRYQRDNGIVSDKSDDYALYHWLHNSLTKWFVSQSVEAFTPMQSYFTKDKSFSERLFEFLNDSILKQNMECNSNNNLVLDAFETSYNSIISDLCPYITKSERTGVSMIIPDFVESFDVFKIIDPIRATKWASIYLNGIGGDDVIYYGPNKPLNLRLFTALSDLVPQTSTQCEYYTRFYNWSVYSTDIPAIQSQMPNIFLRGLDATYGENRSEQKFDLVSSLLSSVRDEILAPIDAINLSLNSLEMSFGDQKAWNRFSQTLHEKSFNEIKHFIKKLPDNEKEKWKSQRLLRQAYLEVLVDKPQPPKQFSHKIFGSGGVLDELGGAELNVVAA